MPDHFKRILRVLSSTPFLVALGLGLRTYHYARNPAMWHDEAYLVLNVLNKDFAALLGKLDFAEAAPPLFLWIEKLVVLVLGDSTFALRLVPYLASCLALVLFARIVPRVLSARGVPWALLVFACSDHLLWHTCEAKPYSTDVLMAMLLLHGFIATRAWAPTRRALIFAVPAPAIIFLSYPGVFLMGGVLLALCPALGRGARWKDRAAYLALAATVAIAFAALVHGPVRAQRCAEMDSCWEGCFANLDRPSELPGWIVVNTAQICRYCCEPAGNLLLIPAVVGAVLFWKRWKALLTNLLAPCFLALAASSFNAYPYTAARVLVYTAPAWALLIGEGVPAIVLALPSLRTSQTLLRSVAKLGAVTTVALVLLTPGYSLFHVLCPQPRTECGRAADYVLQRVQAGDVITSDAPESSYYLRRTPAFVQPEQAKSSRIWLVGTGRTEHERLACIRRLKPASWRVVRERDYERTTVYRLERRSGGSPHE